MKQQLLIVIVSLFGILEIFQASNLTVVNPTKSYFSNPPTWLTSPYFRAGNQNLITNLTGQNLTPNFTFTYLSAFTDIPYLAYGLKNYRGNDYFGQQKYEIINLGVTSSTFIVAFQIYGFTQLWLLNIAYIAVQPTFPHHFNTFDNVPLNYSSGNLKNITAMKTTLQYFTQYINYTKQATGRKYTKFTEPYSSNSIVLFMTMMWVKGSKNNGSNVYYPIKFHVYSNIINESFYTLNATLEIKVQMTNVHFSTIIFNSDDIQSSKKYYVIYEKWYNDMYGGFLQIPEAFVNNFIMGVTSFEVIDGTCGYEYQWQFTNFTNNTQILFGVQILLSWTLTNTCGFSWSQSSIIYIQTWLCQPPFNYFNGTNGFCQTLCGGFAYEDPTTLQCKSCNDTNCYQCESSNKSICTDCASYLHFQLVNDQCVCTSGYFQVLGVCQQCSYGLSGCLNCTYDFGYRNSSFNSSNFTCTRCDQSINYFLTGSSCTLCNLSFCALCYNLTSCKICIVGKGLSQLLTCTDCFIIGCTSCLSTDPNNCLQCNQTLGFFLQNITKTCTSTCGDGLVSLGVETCDDNNTISFDGCSNICLVETYYDCIGSPSVCKPICGDSVTYGYQTCDDGNNLNNDGCSSNCSIEYGYKCVGSPSNCTISHICGDGIFDPIFEGCDDGNTISLDGCDAFCKKQIIINFVSVIKEDECNELTLTFKIEPHHDFAEDYNFTNLIQFNNSNLYFKKTTFLQDYLSFRIYYLVNLQNQDISLTINSSQNNQSKSTYLLGELSNIISILPSNNLAALYLDQNLCSTKLYLEYGYFIGQSISYAILILSLGPAKIVGLQLFGVLQLAYISLGSIDQINFYLAPLLKMKAINGLNQPIFQSKSETITKRVKSISYYPSFLDNFNFMFAAILVEIFIALILYILSRFLKSTVPVIFKIANRLLKEILLTLILFNSFNIAYSLAIHLKYQQQSHLLSIIAIAVIFVIILCMMVAIMTAEQQGFGQFKDKFKRDPLQKNYMVITLLYRITLGFLLGYNNEEELSTLFGVGITLAFLLYNLINLPFSKAYHNYRGCICHITQFITIFVSMFYRSMKSTSDPSTVPYIFLPAKIQVGMICICIIVSLIILIYDLIIWLRQFYHKKNKSSNSSEIGIKQANKSTNNMNNIIVTQQYFAYND